MGDHTRVRMTGPLTAYASGFAAELALKATRIYTTTGHHSIQSASLRHRSTGPVSRDDCSPFIQRG